LVVGPLARNFALEKLRAKEDDKILTTTTPKEKQSD
jgi:hypothetical protein